LKQKIYSHNISSVGNCSNLVSLGLDNGQIRFIDLNSGSFTHTIKAHPSNQCLCVEWSPNRENVVASAGSDGRIALWDIRTAKSCMMYLNFEKTTINKTPPSTSYKSLAHSDSVIGLKFTQDGQNLISLGKDNKIRLWDAYSGLNKLVNFGKVLVDDAVSQSRVQISCTETCFPNYLFVPSGNNLLKFNILSGELKQIYKGHFELINSVCYNSALNEAYTGSRDHNILIWSCDNKKAHLEKSNEPSSKRFKANNSFPSAHSILSGARRNKESTNQDNWSDDDS
jgi:DNA excision repair protein ERCC-8